MNGLDMFCGDDVQYIMMTRMYSNFIVYSLFKVPMTVGHKLDNFLPHMLKCMAPLD